MKAVRSVYCDLYFFFNDTATTEIYTLSLHDALPISRTVNPTEEGRLYYEHCLRILAEIAEIERKLAEKKDSPSGVLRVSAPTVMGRRWIAPLIPQFREAFPEVEIRLQLTDRLADLVEEQVDVAIRRGYLQDSSLISRRVAPDFRVACASPEYLAQHGTPATPADLKDHNCLLLRFPGSRRLNRGIKSQQVGAFGDILNEGDHIADFSGGCGKGGDLVVGGVRRLIGTVDDGVCFGDLRRDFLN